MPHFSLPDYAATVAAHMQGPCDAGMVLAALQLSDRAGGFFEIPGGFVATFRCAWESLPLVEAKDLAALAELPIDELTSGPVLVVAETLALLPGVIHRFVRELIRASGVEAVAAYRDEGTRWKVQKVRRELRRRQ